MDISGEQMNRQELDGVIGQTINGTHAPFPNYKPVGETNKSIKLKSDPTKNILQFDYKLVDTGE